MPDNVTVDNADLTDFDVATDEDGDGKHVQKVKWASQVENSSDLVPGDAIDGPYVQLGNVSITSTADYRGLDTYTRIGDGTNTASVTATSGTYEGVVQALIDQTGALLPLLPPKRLSVTPTLSTSPAYGADDVMDTDDLEFEQAVAVPGGTGHVVALTIIDKDDLAHDTVNGQYHLHLFSDAVTPGTENSPFTGVANDTEASTYQGTISTASTGEWHDLGPAKVYNARISPPLPFACASTIMYGALIADSPASGVHTAAGLDIIPHVLRD